MTEFRDFLVGELFWYSSVEKVLYRASNPHEQYDEYAELATCLPRLLSKELPDDPVTEFQFMSRFNDFEERVHFISQEIFQNDESNQLEYSINVLFDGKASNFTFVVDVKTKLPLQVLMTGMEERKTLTFNIDYPETGPKNIHDMGIPKDVDIVNRIESDEVSLLMASVRSGAVRFDDYRAIVVHHDPNDKYGGGMPRLNWCIAKAIVREEVIVARR